MTRPRLVCLLSLLVLFLPATARAEGTFVDWTSFMPATATGFDPGSSDECVSGKLACVDKVIREMTKDFDRLAAACDHNVIFSLAYLRTTEEYKRSVTTPGFYSDPAFLNYEDATFAAYYMRPLNAYRAGRRSEVPMAWQIAFDAARDRKVSAAGNAFLGFNAHIQRDLPYVLAEIGLVKPDGSSRKPDHDKVNQFLNNVSFTAELSRRFDPSFDDSSLDGTTIDDTLIFQLFPAWREEAWRNAERLVAARTPLARALVEQSIEALATTTAQSFRAAFAYKPWETSAARDAHCAAHHDDV